MIAPFFFLIATAVSRVWPSPGPGDRAHVTWLTADLEPSRFACRHCGDVVIDRRLLDALLALQGKVGRPLVILSGYRCPPHNRDIGGELRSYHTKGQAADIRAPGVPIMALFQAALEIPAFRGGGIGLYLNRKFLHLDIRPQRFRWIVPPRNALPNKTHSH